MARMVFPNLSIGIFIPQIKNQMGKYADSIINGGTCSFCGVMFEAEHGFPVACHDCFEPDDGVAKATHDEL